MAKLVKPNPELRAQLNFMKAAQDARRFRSTGDIYIPEATRREIRDKYCPGCAKEKKNPREYFGEEFCYDCFDRFIHGHGPG